MLRRRCFISKLFSSNNLLVTKLIASGKSVLAALENILKLNYLRFSFGGHFSFSSHFIINFSFIIIITRNMLTVIMQRIMLLKSTFFIGFFNQTFEILILKI